MEDMSKRRRSLATTKGKDASHEQKHLCSHIEQFYHIDSNSEEAAYLAGDVAKTMFPIAKKYMCI